MNEAAAPGGFRVEAAGGEGAGEAACIVGACLPQPWSPADVEALLASGRGFLWLLLDGASRARGALLGERVLDEAHVHQLAVEGPLRRRGAGSALLGAALEGARGSGVRRVLLELRASSRPARALYARHGFRLVGRRPRYYHDGEDALLLEHRLELRDAGAAS